MAKYVPFDVRGLSTSSSTSSSLASSTSSSQDTDLHGKSETRRVDSQKPKTHKNEDDEELRSELMQDVPEWLQDFKGNLVGKNVQPHQTLSQKWYWARVSTVSKLTSRKDRNCDICVKTKITRASCQNRTVQSCPERKMMVI